MIDRVIRIVAGILFAFGAAPFAAAQAAPPPVEAFSRLPAMESPTLSPDGRYFAHFVTMPEGTFLVVRRTDTFEAVGNVNTAGVKARGLTWAGDDYVVVIISSAVRNPLFRGPLEIARPVSVKVSDMSIQPLMKQRQRMGGATLAGNVMVNLNRARVVGRDPETGWLLIPDLDPDGDEFELYLVDPSNDSRRTVDKGSAATVDWIVDSDGKLAVQVTHRVTGGRGLLEYLVPDGVGWRPIYQEEGKLPETGATGLLADGRLAMRARRDGSDRFGLYPMDVETGQFGEALVIDDAYDAVGYHYDPYTNLVLGGVIGGEHPQVVWFDEELGALQEQLAAGFGGAGVTLESWSRDRSKFIFSVFSGEAPTVFYMLDRETMQARAIESTYPEAYAAGVAPRLSIKYPARDGVSIPGYLTIGDDVARPAPLIVLPHGGPEAHDTSGFDWLAHFLASRGYAVLQPNFRGSSGYGVAWRDAGRGEWGTGVMQHDLSDGVAALVEAGIADPDKVCIVGASYGGYAALAGATFTPELYACAAAIAPVADLNTMMAYELDRSGYGSSTMEYWHETIGGDLGAARGRLAAISPADHVENVRAPILLIHGRDDSVVPISQSRRMEDALSDAGKDVTFVELDGEDHWLSGAATRHAMMEALDAFLAEHLGD